jgi:hypothetical protein
LNQLDAPNFRTISEFRKPAPEGAERTVQAGVAAVRDGLVKLGHVALDSTKIKDNVSMHKAMNYGLAAEEPECRKSDFRAIGRTAPGRHAHRCRD